MIADLQNKYPGITFVGLSWGREPKDVGCRFKFPGGSQHAEYRQDWGESGEIRIIEDDQGPWKLFVESLAVGVIDGKQESCTHTKGERQS